MSLEDRIQEINRQWLKENKLKEGDTLPRVMLGNSMPEPRIVSTGNPALDYALDGGIPEGTIVEIFGKAGCSKTTTASYLMAEVQKLGKDVLYYNTEGPNRPIEAWNIAKVDASRVGYIRAEKNAEDGLNIIRELLIDPKTGLSDPKIGLVVIDSISSLAPSAEIESIKEKGLEANSMANLARLTSKLFRMICGTGLLNRETILCLINQERTDIGGYGAPSKPTGGNAPEYYAKIIIWLSLMGKAGQILGPKRAGQENPDVIGNTVRFRITKNNTGAAPYREGTWQYFEGIGIDTVGAVVNQAMDLGLIKKVANTYHINILKDEELSVERIVGAPKTSQFVKDNPEVCDSLKKHSMQMVQFMQDNGIVMEDGFPCKLGVPVDLLKLYLESIGVSET